MKKKNERVKVVKCQNVIQNQINSQKLQKRVSGLRAGMLPRKWIQQNIKKNIIESVNPVFMREFLSLYMQKDVIIFKKQEDIYQERKSKLCISFVRDAITLLQLYKRIKRSFKHYILPCQLGVTKGQIIFSVRNDEFKEYLLSQE